MQEQCKTKEVPLRIPKKKKIKIKIIDSLINIMLIYIPQRSPETQVVILGVH